MIENTITESVDYNKLTQLARYGLVDKSNVQKLIAAFKKMEDGKILQPAQRELMLNVLTDLTGIITGDSQMFMKAKKAVSEEVESITELTAEEKRLVNTMYDKKGNLTAVGKKVMDHGKKNRFPHNTSASQGQRMGGKSTMYSEDALIDEKYDTPVKKKPVSMMSKAEKDKNDERRKSYKEFQKSLRKEETQIDEARPSQRHPLEGHPYHKKTNAELEYIGKDAHKAAQAMKGHNPSAEGKYLDQANDSATVRHFRKTSGTPDWYKKKYGHSMKEEAQIDEISMTKMAAYAPKAVKSRNDAKAATHSADSNRVANAKKVIAKRKAGADNYNKKMWGYGNVAPTKESAGLDEKGPAIKQDNIKVIRTADKAHSDAMGRTPAGRKKPTKAPVVEAKVGPSHDEIMKAIGNTQSSAQGMAILQKKFKLTAAQARKHMDMFLKDDVQIDEKAGSFHNPKKDKIVDSKKFDVYKKHMKTHNLDEPTVRMAHDNPDHGESKRMMKNPKYSKGLELYKASMKEATYSDTGWKKPEVKKDKFGNVIKDKNVAKNLAKSAMKSFKDIRKK